MSANREIERAIREYLEKVAAEMGNVAPDEKDSILREVESHVYAALEKRAGGNATLGDLEVILAGMAPPGSYGAKARAVAQSSVTSQSERRLCKLPIIAAFWAPFGVAAFLMAAIGVPVPAGTQWPPLWYKILAMGVVLPLGVAAPFAATALGLIGISRIRSSRGSLTGMPLAVTVSLFYPTVVFNIAVWYVSAAVAGATFESDKTANLFVLAMLVLGVIVSFVAFVKIWRWATRQVKEGEFT